MSKDSLEAIKKIARYYGHRFDDMNSFEHLSGRDVIFLHKIFSAILVKDFAIRDSVDPKIFAISVKKIERELASKGYTIVT